jgi:hypothetical protein
MTGRLGPDAPARRNGDGAPMRESRSAERQPLFVSFEGGEWSCFAVRPLSGHRWGVAYTHGPALDLQPSCGGAEFLAGLPTRAAAVSVAAALAKGRFAAAAARDSTRPRPRHVVTPLAPCAAAADTAGLASRIGPPITVAPLSAPGVGGRSG